MKTSDVRLGVRGESRIFVSAHARGTLTDVAMERAVEAGASVAVSPCCHRPVTRPGLERWMASDVAQDVMRAQRLAEAGYQVNTSVIPHEITSKNWVLVGDLEFEVLHLD